METTKRHCSYHTCTTETKQAWRNCERNIKILCNLSSAKAKIVQNSQKKQEMYSYGGIVARNVEKRIEFLTNIYTVEGPRGPEQIH